MSFPSLHGRLNDASRVAALLGGLGILLIAVMVTVDVLLRSFAGVTLGGATEVAGFIFAAATALSYPYVLIQRANVRIDVAYAWVGPVPRAGLDLLGLLMMLGFMILLTRSAFGVFANSWHGGGRSVGVVNVPLWMPQSLWLLGLALTAVTAAVLTFGVCLRIWRRDWRGVSALAGVPSISETIEEETHLEPEDASPAAPEEDRR